MRFSGIAGSLEGQFKDLIKIGDPARIMQSGAPEFLKIAALEKIKEIRNGGTQPPPQGTVAQRVVQETMGGRQAPQGMPPQGMPPQGMPPQGMPPDVNEMGVASLPGEAPPRPPAMEQGLASLPADMNFADGGVVSFSRGGYEDPAEAFERRKKFYQDTGEYYSDPYLGFGGLPMGEMSGLGAMVPSDVENALRQPELTPMEMRAMFGVPVEQKTPTPEEDQFSAEVAPPPDTMGGYKDLMGMLGTRGGAPSMPAMEPMPKSPQMKKPEDWSFEEYKKQEDEINKAYGVDPEFFSKQQQGIEQERADAEKEFTSDKWLALAEAGARMMQTPGSFGTALGAGISTGAQSLKGAARQFRQNKKEITDMQRRLSIAQQQEAQGKSEQAQRTKDAVQQRYINAVNRQAEIDANYAMQEWKANNDRNMTEYEQQQMWARTKFGAEMKLRAAMLSSSAESYKANLDYAKFVADFYKDSGLSSADLVKLEETARSRAEAELTNDPKYQEMTPVDQEIALAKKSRENLESMTQDIRNVDLETRDKILARTLNKSWSASQY